MEYVSEYLGLVVSLYLLAQNNTHVTEHSTDVAATIRRSGPRHGTWPSRRSSRLWKYLQSARLQMQERGAHPCWVLPRWFRPLGVVETEHPIAGLVVV